MGKRVGNVGKGRERVVEKEGAEKEAAERAIYTRQNRISRQSPEAGSPHGRARMATLAPLLLHR